MKCSVDECKNYPVLAHEGKPYCAEHDPVKWVDTSAEITT